MEKKVEICQNKLFMLNKNKNKKSPANIKKKISKAKILNFLLNDPLSKISSEIIGSYKNRNNQKNDTETIQNINTNNSVYKKRFTMKITKDNFDENKKNNSIKNKKTNITQSLGVPQHLSSPTPISQENINLTAFNFSTQQSNEYMISDNNSNNIKELKSMFSQNKLKDMLSPITSRDNHSEYYSKTSEAKTKTKFN